MAALSARSLSGSTVSRRSEARRRSGSCLSSCQRSPRCSSPWWLIVYCFFANGFTIGCYKSIFVFIPDIMVAFDSNSTLMGWLFSIDILLIGILTPVVAYLTSKFGTRPVVMAAGTFAASGVLMLSQAKHIGHVCFGIGVVTASSKAILYASTMLLTRRTFQKHYALANGINISGYSCFLFLFPPILEALRKVYGWRGACLILSGCMLNTVVMGLLMRPRQMIRNPVTEDGQTCLGQAVDTPDKHQEGETDTSTSLHMDSHVKSQQHENANGSKMIESAQSQTGLFQCHQASLNVDEEISVNTKDQRYLPDQENTSHDGVQFSYCLSANAVDESMIKDENNPMLPKTGNSEHRPLSISSPRHGSSGNSQTPLQETTSIKHDEDSIVVVSGEGCGPLQKYRRYFISQNYHTFIIYSLSVFLLTTALSIFMIHITPSLKESGVGTQDIATCWSIWAASNLVGRLTCGMFISKGIISSANLMTFTEFTLTVSILVVYLSPQFGVRVTAILFFGVGSGLVNALPYVIHRQIVDPGVDVKTLSIFMIVEGSAGPVGGVFGGLLRDLNGSYRLTFMSSAGLYFFAALLMVLVTALQNRRMRSSQHQLKHQ